LQSKGGQSKSISHCLNKQTKAKRAGGVASSSRMPA
jgi:hypothetical protein